MEAVRNESDGTGFSATDAVVLAVQPLTDVPVTV
jgi:hypothetical protein